MPKKRLAYIAWYHSCIYEHIHLCRLRHIINTTRPIKSLMIKMSGDGAKYNRSSTFCLLSFIFIRKSNSSANVAYDSPGSITDHENDGSGLSSAGKGSYICTWIHKITYIQIGNWIYIYNFVSDVHTIAVTKAAENYENIKEGFRDIITRVNHYIKHPKITIFDEDYELKFTLCADYKVCRQHYINAIADQYDT